MLPYQNLHLFFQNHQIQHHLTPTHLLLRTNMRIILINKTCSRVSNFAPNRFKYLPLYFIYKNSSVAFKINDIASGASIINSLAIAWYRSYPTNGINFKFLPVSFLILVLRKNSLTNSFLNRILPSSNFSHQSSFTSSVTKIMFLLFNTAYSYVSAQTIKSPYLLTPSFLHLYTPEVFVTYIYTHLPCIVYI